MNADSKVEEHQTQNEESQEEVKPLIPCIKFEMTSEFPERHSPSSHTSAESRDRISKLERRVESLERMIKQLSLKKTKGDNILITSFTDFEDFFLKMLPINFKKFLGEKEFSLKLCLQGKLTLTQLSLLIYWEIEQ
jgi:hypothetical protein